MRELLRRGRQHLWNRRRRLGPQPQSIHLAPVTGNPCQLSRSTQPGPLGDYSMGLVKPADFVTIKAVAVWLPLVVPYKNHA